MMGWLAAGVILGMLIFVVVLFAKYANDSRWRV